MSMTALFLVLGILVLCVVCYEAIRIGIHARKAVLAGKRAVPVSKAHASPHKSVLVIGDSTSFGTGAREAKNSLVGRLAQDYPNIAITNASRNAMNVRELKHTLSNIRENHFDIIMMHIGGVDTLSFTSSAQITHHFKEIAEHTVAMGAEAVILVSVNNVGTAPFIRFPLSTLFDWRSRKMTELFSKLSNTHNMHHVPLYEKREDDPLGKEPEILFSDDKIHPNDAGYAVWYRMIQNAVDPYLSCTNM